MLQYDPSAATDLLYVRKPHHIESRLLRAREEVANDLRLFNSGQQPPVHKLPLDAGFIEYPQRLLDGQIEDGGLDHIQQVADHLKNSVDTVVSLGIGGSYMGARAIFEALCHRHHNVRTRDQRGGVPRVYFEGHNVDNDSQRDLLDVLPAEFSEGPDDRWGMIVISKSGGTLETAAAFRVFREALDAASGGKTSDLCVPITGTTGKLRDVARQMGIPESQMLPVPDGIGGRFSILTAVGLLPAAVMGVDIRALLQGAADMTRRFFEAAPGENPVLDFVAVGHLFEVDRKMPVRVLSTWGDRLESVGLWYDQLLAESLGKHERGATPLTVVNTRDLHSRGQQHQEGARDRIITNVLVRKPTRPPVTLPAADDSLNQDQLNAYAGISLSDIQQAAFSGTNKAYADDERPTADIILPQLDAHALGELFQMLMLATALEGRLININPYGQPGVEAYKRNMKAILDRRIS